MSDSSLLARVVNRPRWWRGALFLAAASLAPAPYASAEVLPPAPHGPTPSERQLAWHAMEFYGFVHFTVNTFRDTEWGYGDESPADFAPTDLDPRDWAAAAASAGMRGLVLTAKHHDGFCLWPSKLTEHTLARSPGLAPGTDVVRMTAEACKEQGLRFGVYLSPWDRNHAEYARAAYVDYYHRQLEELLTGYGDLFIVWHDGANGGDGYYAGAREKRAIDGKTYYRFPELWETTRRLQPGAVIFSDAGPDVRWIGNERGFAPDACWAKVRPEGTFPGLADATRLGSGDADGTAWRPAEVDVSIRKGWFYHASEQPKSLAELLEIYYHSVGKGCCLNLNIPPDRRGKVPEADAAVLRELGAALQSTFAVDLARGGEASASNVRGGAEAFAASCVTDGDRATYWAADDAVRQAEIEVRLPSATAVNRVRLQEHIPLGQRVEAFALDARVEGAWREVVQGTTIGARRILRFDEVVTDRLRLRLLASQACPTLSTLEAYHATKEPAPPTTTP